jgi:hypothetical protein
MGEGKALLLSGRKTPDPSSIRIPRAPALEFDFKNCKQLIRQSSGRRVSGFRKRIYFPEHL